jgi:uncharacterized phage-associated protein
MFTIFDIADHILANAKYGLTNRELQKMLYLAQGFHLAQFGTPLFEEEFQAWKHGPVNSGIYHKYKKYGYLNIDRPNNGALAPIAVDVAAFLMSLLLSFNAVAESKLVEYSHFDSPWAEKYMPDRNINLSKSTLKEYFKNFSSFEDYKDAAERKFNFHNFIKSRAQYLERLPSIGDAWISGISMAPNEVVCNVAKAFLVGIEKHLLSQQAKPSYPKIVMGPIPTGGVSLEFCTMHSTYLHFNNTKNVEIEIEKDGHFSDQEISLDQFEENFAEFYEIIAI